MSIDFQHKPDVGQAIADIIVDGEIGDIHTDGEILDAIYKELQSRGYEV
jgi:hypothetical protein